VDKAHAFDRFFFFCENDAIQMYRVPYENFDSFIYINFVSNTIFKCNPTILILSWCDRTAMCSPADKSLLFKKEGLCKPQENVEYNIKLEMQLAS